MTYNCDTDIETLGEAADSEFLQRTPNAILVLTISPGGKFKLFATGRANEAKKVDIPFDISGLKTIEEQKAILVSSLRGSGGEFICDDGEYYWAN